MPRRATCGQSFSVSESKTGHIIEVSTAGYNAGVMPGKRVLLCTFGSLGDLYPVLALAIELKRRGHLPVIATLPGYRDRIHAAGVHFHGVRPDIDVSDTSILPRAMHPRDGA